MSLSSFSITVRALRAGEVDAGVGGGDVGDVDVHLPLRVEPGHLPVDLIDGAGRRRDVVVALVQARGDAVVDDDAGLVGHQRIARAADLLLLVGPGIHALDERGRVRPAHVETAERRHVDHADAFAHRAHLALDRARAHRPSARSRRGASTARRSSSARRASTWRWCMAVWRTGSKPRPARAANFSGTSGGR